jgi:crotonobetainyl-CoA:carnitine CoA-transferase CaiB-like acyl-CoA transferase
MPRQLEVGLESFTGLRVVELGTWVTAPAAAALLGDLGADVIKVEPPRGDPSRGVFDAVGAATRDAPTFALDNRAKRSIVIDLESRDGSKVLEDLVCTADVFITNVRVDALERIGLSPEQLIAKHPRLVYASITGFGRLGEEGNRPSYDIGAFWARSGLSHQLSPAGEPPLNVIGAIGDHVTSLSATVAILAALRDREHTGRGGLVETSLLQTGAWVLGWDLALQATRGRVHRADLRDDTRTPLMNSYRTADDRWLFLMGLEVDRHFSTVCHAVGRPELVDDPRFVDAASVRSNRRELIAYLDQAFATKTLAEWRRILDDAGVWWTAVSTPPEVLEDPQLHANAAFGRIAVSGEVWPMITSPFRVFEAPTAVPATAPDLGEHTDEILKEVRREA